RSPHAHARIARLDVEGARRAPGVVAVVAGAEVRHLGPLPVNRLVPDMRVPPHPIIADTHVRTAGTPVAAVVAEDPYRARDAVELIDVAYEPLAGVPEPEAAVGDGAHVLFADIERNRSFTRTLRERDAAGAMRTAARVPALRARNGAPLGAALMNAAAGPPWTHARLLPGAYVVPACDITVTGALTTTTPVAAYRGAGRPEACFFIERLMDTAARALGLDPAEIRRRNFVPPDRFPFRSVTGQVYDSGDYGKALELALAAADYTRLKR